eukprot:350404-Pelagomonas_calceolata.AAC.1
MEAGCRLGVCHLHSILASSKGMEHPGSNVMQSGQTLCKATRLEYHASWEKFGTCTATNIT